MQGCVRRQRGRKAMGQMPPRQEGTPHPQGSEKLCGPGRSEVPRARPVACQGFKSVPMNVVRVSLAAVGSIKANAL